MIGHDDFVGGEVEAVYVAFNRGGERGDIGGAVMEAAGGAHGRLPAHFFQLGKGAVIHAGRRGGAILRVERHDTDTVAALVLQDVNLAGDTGVAVIHGEIDDEVIAADTGAEFVGLRARVGEEGGAVLGPDFLIRATRFAGAEGQDGALEDELPDRLGDFDDARVGEEFRQVAAHGPIVGAIWRAEINEQDADFALDDLRVRRRERADGAGDAV